MIRRTLYSKATFGILIVLVVLLGHATWNVFNKYKEAKNNENRVSRELYKLKKREAALTAEIDRLKTSRGMEEEIRRRYNAVKKGEGVVVVVDSENSGNAPDNTGNDNQQKRIWNIILDIFK